MNIFEAFHAVFTEHFGDAFFRRPPPRALDLRGFSMTRREAARWLDAIEPPHPSDDGPTRGDYAEEATREELRWWAKTNNDGTPQGRAIAALYLAAARGPDFATGEP